MCRCLTLCLVRILSGTLFGTVLSGTVLSGNILLFGTVLSGTVLSGTVLSVHPIIYLNMLCNVTTDNVWKQACLPKSENGLGI